MTEQEKRRRRREMERRMRTRTENRRKSEKRRGLTSFRLYVTAVLVGGCLLISAFHSETSEMVCAKVKEIISMQTSAEELAVWKNRLTAYFKEKDIIFPVFWEKEEEKEYRPDVDDSP